ncbi:uncharacterized protein LOC111631874 [Centruroides sculpturatus]|uniref:uncharacterized protein LOC111631874 n=1 Tax=Centruroides sculpturatus TaxID=218467 RepID=UPI000C6EB95A|nr:uncharacterized protein LOC111631874 [Centruroides sculpturatus]
MFKKIESPADYEIQSVIRFLSARNLASAEIHCQICYGDNAMSDSKVQKCLRMFKDGWVSRSVLYTIVSEKLNYRKLCSRWAPRLLSDDHKTKRLGSALSFLTQYDQEGDKLLDHIVTGDETWDSLHRYMCNQLTKKSY